MANITINRINTTINAADEGILQASTGQTNTVLNNYTESLSPDEREELFGLDVENRVFAQEALEEATTNGGILPGYIAVPELDNDLRLYNQLESIETVIENQLQRIKDTKRLAGHEAYAMALTIYKLYESAHLAGISGATASYTRLKQRFLQQGGGAPPASNTPPTPANPA